MFSGATRSTQIHLSHILLVGVVCLGGPSFLFAQGGRSETIDNARVIQMAKMGLGDAIIIAKIKTSKCVFSLADEDFLELSKAGVSDTVIAAMLEASVLTEPIITADETPLTLHTMAQGKIGGRLGSMLTLGIKSVKWKAYLQGRNSRVLTSRSPTLIFDLPANDAIDNYILVRMDRKKDRRELEMGAAGGAVGGKIGVRAEDTVRTTITDLGGSRYQLIPVKMLKKGEYIIYVVGSADTIKGVYGKGYDFSVQ